MSLRAGWLAIATALAATGVTAAQSAPAAPLNPTAKWWLDYDEAQCTAGRNYGDGRDFVQFGFKPSPMGKIIRLLVARKGSFILGDQYPVTLQFDDQPPQKLNSLQYLDDKTKLRVISVNVPRSEIDMHKTARTITIATTGLKQTFALSDVPELLAELDKCSADLREVWNTGHGERIGKSAEPVQPLQDVFRPTDYPMSAAQGLKQGTVEAVLLIDEAGQIRDCSVETTSEIPTLDTMSCFVFQQRAQFAPALDPAGKPIKSSYSKRITWRMGS